ncbi:MAG: hypothetical protein ACFFC3_13595, partial [Candidatus Odinarchaeota archaeon]
IQNINNLNKLKEIDLTGNKIVKVTKSEYPTNLQTINLSSKFIPQKDLEKLKSDKLFYFWKD